jgi:hypothetical protein
VGDGKCEDVMPLLSPVDGRGHATDLHGPGSRWAWWVDA